MLRYIFLKRCLTELLLANESFLAAQGAESKRISEACADIEATLLMEANDLCKKYDWKLGSVKNIISESDTYLIFFKDGKVEKRK